MCERHCASMPGIAAGAPPVASSRLRQAVALEDVAEQVGLEKAVDDGRDSTGYMAAAIEGMARCLADRVSDAGKAEVMAFVLDGGSSSAA